jgi:hypothetical protein
MKKETLVLFSAPMLKAMLEGRKTLPGDCPRQGFKIKKVKAATGKIILQKLNYMHNNPHPPIAISITCSNS